MLKVDNTDASTVTSDSDLVGFNVDLRSWGLTNRLNLTYTLSILSSYGEIMVETRRGNCDIGWAALFNLGSRERCVEDFATCRALSALPPRAPRRVGRHGGAASTSPRRL